MKGNTGTKNFGLDAQQVILKQPRTESGDVEVATFAGGCFWGVQLAFQRVPGVIRSEVR